MKRLLPSILLAASCSAPATEPFSWPGPLRAQEVPDVVEVLEEAESEKPASAVPS